METPAFCATGVGLHHTCVIPSVAVRQSAIEANLKDSGFVVWIVAFAEICIHEANFCAIGKVPVCPHNRWVTAGGAVNL